MNQPKALEIHHLTVMYGAQAALDDISVTVPAGVICAVIGPNGAGKSTFLKSILGLIKPLAGTITIDGISAADAYTSIAYVPQRVSVDWNFPISVFEVVMMGRYAGGWFFSRTTVQDKQIVHDALSMVDMLFYADKLIGELSGGQQQRVFLARALAQQRKFLILDEPFNGIDAATEKLCIDILKRLQRAGVTILVVHHDIAAVCAYADWAIVLRTKLIQAGPVSALECGTSFSVHSAHMSAPTERP